MRLRYEAIHQMTRPYTPATAMLVRFKYFWELPPVQSSAISIWLRWGRAVLHLLAAIIVRLIVLYDLQISNAVHNYLFKAKVKLYSCFTTT